MNQRVESPQMLVAYVRRAAIPVFQLAVDQLPVTWDLGSCGWMLRVSPSLMLTVYKKGLLWDFYRLQKLPTLGYLEPQGFEGSLHKVPLKKRRVS